MQWFWNLFGSAPSPESTLEGASRLYWTKMQEALVKHGFRKDPPNGLWDDETDAQVRALKGANGLRDDRALTGPETLKILMSEPKPKPAPTPAAGDLPWLVEARKHIGIREIPGGKHHPKVVTWWAYIGASWFVTDETPWCGAFVAAMLKQTGFPILSATLAPRALEWGVYGKPVPPGTYGAIMVMKRDGGGHVTFCVGRDKQGRYMGLGGNQSNAVGIDPFDKSRIIAWRYPSSAKLDTRPLPVLDSNGRPASNNEA